jgi:hypothetical protein
MKFGVQYYPATRRMQPSRQSEKIPVVIEKPAAAAARMGLPFGP